jgi:hypothetical protein
MHDKQVQVEGGPFVAMSACLEDLKLKNIREPPMPNTSSWG